MRVYLLTLFAWFGTVLSGTAATVLAKGLFSYEAPAGWAVVIQSNSNIGIARTGNKESDYASILSKIQKWNSLHELIQSYLDNLEKRQHAHVLLSEPFLTTAGLDGFRVVATGPAVAGADHSSTEKVFYFFDAGSDVKIIIEGNCPASRAGYYVPLFDAAIKTFTLE